MENRRHLFLIYGFFIFCIIGPLVYKAVFSINALVFAIFLFGFIAGSGFFLSRILKLNFDNFLDNLALWIILGFLVSFILNLLCMFLGWNITYLAIVYQIIVFLLFLVAFLKDMLGSGQNEFRVKINLKNPVFWLVILLFAFLAILVGVQGSLFKGGDPNYHLAILRKIFEGGSLSPYNLGFTKEASLHLAYGLPVWHITLGAMAKILKVDVLFAWGASAMPLLIMAFISWYWFLKRIFPRKLALLALVLFAIFYCGSNGYLFTCLALPDTFNRLIILPLALGLAVSFIFEKRDFRLLFCFALLSLFMAMIHMTQYFYLFFTLILFLLLYAGLSFKDKDYKDHLKRTVWVLLGAVAFILPLVIILIFKGALSETLSSMLENEETRDLRYGSFSSFDLYYQIPYLLLPILLIFYRKNSRLLLVLAIFLLTPIIYFIPPLQHWAMKFLGYIFVNRLYGTMTLHFIMWAVLLGLFLTFFNRISSFLKEKTKPVYYIMIALLGVLFFIFLTLQIKSRSVLNFYNFIFSDGTQGWVNANYLWLLFGVILLTILIFIGVYKKQPNLEAIEIKDRPLELILLLLTILFFTSPLWNGWQKVFQENSLDHLTTPATSSGIFNQEVLNDDKIKELKEIIPQKSILLANNNPYFIPLTVDVYMASYPHSSLEKRFNQIFGTSLCDKNKLEYVKRSKADYIYLVSKDDQSLFLKFPAVFQKVKSKGTTIYSVNKKTLDKAILQSSCPEF